MLHVVSTFNSNNMSIKVVTLSTLLFHILSMQWLLNSWTSSRVLEMYCGHREYILTCAVVFIHLLSFIIRSTQAFTTVLRCDLLILVCILNLVFTHILPFTIPCAGCVYNWRYKWGTIFFNFFLYYFVSNIHIFHTPNTWSHLLQIVTLLSLWCRHMV